jgi:hypothetical protein
LERKRQPWVTKQKTRTTLKALGMCGGKPLQGLNLDDDLYPRLSLRSNLGLKLANAFGVFRKIPVIRSF